MRRTWEGDGAAGPNAAARALATAHEARICSRADLPLAPARGPKKRASAQVAREISESTDLLRGAVDLLVKDFYSNSGRDAVKSKRKFINELAENVLARCPGVERVFPLQKDLVTKVAAGLWVPCTPRGAPT